MNSWNLIVPIYELAALLVLSEGRRIAFNLAKLERREKLL